MINLTHRTLSFKHITVLFYDSVSDEEIIKFKEHDALANSLKLIDLLGVDATNCGLKFNKKWLISSIDRNVKDGSLRFPYEQGNHYDSRAIDIVPLTDDELVELPIPLNRNLLLIDYFIEGFKLFARDSLPLIAFEADHLHIDINNPPGIYRMKRTRSFLDHIVHSVSQKLASLLNKAVNDGTLIQEY